jgi:hypothetical protein
MSRAFGEVKGLSPKYSKTTVLLREMASQSTAHIFRKAATLDEVQYRSGLKEKFFHACRRER